MIQYIYIYIYNIIYHILYNILYNISSAGRVSSRTYVFPGRVGRGYGPGWTVVVVVSPWPRVGGEVYGFAQKVCAFA